MLGRWPAARQASEDHCPRWKESRLTTAPLAKIRREQLPPGEVLCQYCTAKCCKYFALPIDTPESLEDWEFVRWYLLHEGATVFKEDDQWYLLVHAVCKHLQIGQSVRHLRDASADLPRVFHRELRIRRRLGLRTIPGNLRTGLGIFRGDLVLGARPDDAQSTPALLPVI